MTSAPAKAPAPEGESAPAEPPPLSAERLHRLRRNYIATGLSALLVFASFHPIDLGILAWVALVPWLAVAAIETRRVAIGISFATTVLYHVVGLAWIALVTPEGWLLTSFLEGFYGVALALLPLWIRRRTGLPLMVALPLVGAALEWIRGNFPFIAFPWLFFGQTQHAHPNLIQILDLTSVYGLTFLVLMVNGALVDAALIVRARIQADGELTARDHRWLRYFALVPAGLLALTWVYGVFRSGQVAEARVEGPRLLVVQPNVPQNLKDSPILADELAGRNLRATEAVLRRLEEAEGEVALDAIVWSETMWPWPLPDTRSPESIEAYNRWYAHYAERYPGYAAVVNSYTRRLFGLAARTGIPVLVGSADDYDASETGIDGLPRHNSYYRIAPTGDPDVPAAVTHRYDKVRLVPASEGIPGKDTALFHWFYRLIKGFVPPGFDVFEAGEGPVLMPVGGWQLAPDICFEISFPELLRQSTAAGADVHVCPANDGWFVRGKGRDTVGSAELPLARDHAIYRAIENRRGVVRCVNRGVSLIVGPTGQVTESVEQAVDGEWREVGVSGTIVAHVPTTELRSFYVRFGNVFAWLCALASAGLVACAWRGKRLVSDPLVEEADPAASGDGTASRGAGDADDPRDADDSDDAHDAREADDADDAAQGPGPSA